MSQDEFTKLYKYLQEEFKRVDRRFEQQDQRFDQVMGAVEGLAGLIRDYQEEMLMLTHKVERLEKWIMQVAQATGVKLTP